MLRDSTEADVEDGLADPLASSTVTATRQVLPTPEPTEVPVTDEPTEVATEAPVATEEPIATESPVTCPQESCTPALDGTGLQNGNMGTSEPQNNGDTGQSNRTAIIINSLVDLLHRRMNQVGNRTSQQVNLAEGGKP